MEAWAICFRRHLRKFPGEPGLIFVIGSCHNLGRGGGRTGLFIFRPMTPWEDCYRALDNYFQSMLALAASPYYDVVGHVIYPLLP